MRVVLASNNKHKLKEMREILLDFKYDLVSKSEMGFIKETVEDQDTFEGNSYKKAKEVSDNFSCIAIADDSGLMVDALSGAPGVYSARYSEEGTDEKNNEKLLKNLENIKNRKAKFVSVITMVFPNGDSIVARGEVHGTIGYELRGTDGFGYDPLFIENESKKTFAELSSEEKNKISHRKRALDQLSEKLKEYEKR